MAVVGVVTMVFDQLNKIFELYKNAAFKIYLLDLKLACVAGRHSRASALFCRRSRRH